VIGVQLCIVYDVRIHEMNSVINYVTKEKYSIYHKLCKIQCRDLSYKVINRRSHAFLQTIEIVWVDC